MAIAVWGLFSVFALKLKFGFWGDYVLGRNQHARQTTAIYCISKIAPCVDLACVVVAN